MMFTSRFVVVSGLLALFSSMAAPSDVFSQKIGDRVVVTATIDTKVYRRKVGKVYDGQISTVTEIKDGWCAISRTTGWMPMQYVMNLDSAEVHYTKRIKKNQNDFMAWAIRGMIRFENEQYAKALEDLNRAISLNPNVPATFNNRGIVLKAMNRFPESLVNLDQALKLRPDYADAHENKGLTLAAIGQYAAAIKSYDEAIKLRRDNPWSYVNRGTARSNAGNYKGAKSDFLRALSMKKNLSDADVGLSVAYLAENNLDKAYRYASSAVEKDPKSGLAYNQRGWTQYKQGKIEEAIFDFNQAIRFAPKLSLAFSNRGVCYNDLGDYELAMRDFNRALALNPNSAIALTNRGRTHVANGDYKRAKADIEKAMKLSPQLLDASSAFAWFLATCPDESFRNGTLAKQYAEKACKTTKWKNWSCLDTLAAAEAELGEFEQAVEHGRKAVELAPESEKADCQRRLALYENEQAYRSVSETSSK